MYKKLLLILFLLQSLISTAQNVLQLTHSKTGEVYVLKTGSTIYYKLSWEERPNYGTLTHVSDSTIFIDNNEYSLEELAMIGGHSKTRKVVGNVMEFMGKALLISGQFTTYTGFEVISNGDIYYVAAGGILSGVGLCLWGVGHVVDFVMTPAIQTIKPHSLEQGWIASITPIPSKDKSEELYGY
jgi:hypothetical protein